MRGKIFIKNGKIAMFVRPVLSLYEIIIGIGERYGNTLRRIAENGLRGSFLHGIG